MTAKTSNMSFSDLLRKSTSMSENIKLNPMKVGRYGLDLPMFTDQMDADVSRANALSKEQERLRGQLKSKTDELDLLKEKLNENYSTAKKVVKLAEPQSNWIAYGIEDKK
jgi:hypothetical protein